VEVEENGGRTPSHGGDPGIRVDSGVEQGDAADGRFDSLMVKLIVTGADGDQGVVLCRVTPES
jgi:acetyl/propionyl-CoA carboxylase alpha subunit